ncbi:MAG: hypothetical protein PHS53_03345 [Candidatus Pacebacteria bacterium]|nr:hypothetical protein [Candidatus Paceibacterota bacterium]MDD5357151.1 hypothetical protein [Candidatus Paceibacterota bacterium]
MFEKLLKNVTPWPKAKRVPGRKSVFRNDLDECCYLVGKLRVCYFGGWSAEIQAQKIIAMVKNGKVSWAALLTDEEELKGLVAKAREKEAREALPPPQRCEQVFGYIGPPRVKKEEPPKWIPPSERK